MLSEAVIGHGIGEFQAQIYLYIVFIEVLEVTEAPCKEEHHQGDDLAFGHSGLSFGWK